MSTQPKFRIWMLTPMLLLLGLLPLCAPRMGMDDQPFQLALDGLRACPQAVSLLGDDVEEGALSLSCGSYESTGGHGHLDWTIPVHGRNGSGELYINATLMGGRWTLNTLELRVENEGEPLDVLSCSP